LTIEVEQARDQPREEEQFLKVQTHLLDLQASTIQSFKAKPTTQ
jgi:hypothetical protein